MTPYLLVLARLNARSLGTLIVVLAMTALGCATETAQQEADQENSIVGVWAFVSETNSETGEMIRDDSTWSGIWVFTDGYHCLARMQDGREGLLQAEIDELSLEEQVAYYRQLYRYSSTAGTYAVEGDVLRRQWDVSLGSSIIGLESVATFSVEGERLIVDLPRRSPDSGPAVRVVYRRLE